MRRRPGRRATPRQVFSGMLTNLPSFSEEIADAITAQFPSIKGVLDVRDLLFLVYLLECIVF